jgi:PQQ-like domain
LNQTLFGWLMVVGLANGCVAAEETSMFRADPAHNGVYLTAAPQNMTVKWTFHTGEAIVSSPTVANRMVYIGSSDNFLYDEIVFCCHGGEDLATYQRILRAERL